MPDEENEGMVSTEPVGRYYLHCTLKWQSTVTLYGFSSVNVDEEVQLGATIEVHKSEEAKVLLEVQKKRKKSLHD